MNKPDNQFDIHHATEKGDMDSLQAAIRSGLVNARNSEGQTPLHISASSWAGGQYMDVMQVLLNAGTDIHALDGKGRSPLHQASAAGRARGVKLLIAQGALVNAADGCGDTPLCLALEGWTQILDNKKSLNRGEWCRYVVYALLNHGAVITENCYQYVANIYYLTRNMGADWNDDLEFISIRRGVLKALIQAGLDPARVYDGRHHLLHVLCGAGAPTKDIKLLLYHGAADAINITFEGSTPLHLHLAYAGIPTLGTVRELLEHGANATIPDGEGRTAIEILRSRNGLKKRRQRRAPPTSRLTRLLEDSGCPPLAA